MTPEKRNTFQQAGLIVGFIVSLLLAVQLIEARFLQPIRECQNDQETRIRMLEKAIARQTPVLEALGRRLEVVLPGDE